MKGFLMRFMQGVSVRVGVMAAFAVVVCATSVVRGDECPVAAAAKAKAASQAHVTLVAHQAETKDIVDTAVGAGSFKTLVAAVTAAAPQPAAAVGRQPESGGRDQRQDP